MLQFHSGAMIRLAVRLRDVPAAAALRLDDSVSSETANQKYQLGDHGKRSLQ